MVKNKRFPNGFRYWMETFYEACALITRYQRDGSGGMYPAIDDVQANIGMVGMYDLAEEWTDEFEKLHKGFIWGVEYDWLETVEIFMLRKAKGKEYNIGMTAKNV